VGYEGTPIVGNSLTLKVSLDENSVVPTSIQIDGSSIILDTTDKTKLTCKEV
jgi:hypothetical protein